MYSGICSGKHQHTSPATKNLGVAITTYSDKLLFLYRDSYYNKKNKSDITEVIVAKSNDGNMDTIKVAWMPEYCMFGNTIVFEEEKDGE